MTKTVRVIKKTRLLKLHDLLVDLMSDVSDEDLLHKYAINWEQLQKVYCKLFYGGYLSREDLVHRAVIRDGLDISHIPLVQLEESESVYECMICGYLSERHFSECPRCRQINLRRLHRHDGWSRSSRFRQTSSFFGYPSVSP